MIAKRILKRCFKGEGEKHPRQSSVPQEEQQRVSAVQVNKPIFFVSC